jgi:transcription termination/antitermination protein NusG
MHQLQWYAVRTRSNYERTVSSLLVEKSIEHFLPAFHEVHQWKDRKKLVEQPLFPGYLFTRIVDSREARISVLSIDGVVRILGNGARIESIPDEEIGAVRRLLDSNNGHQAHPLIREGAWVRVKRGPLKNLEGFLVRIKNETRLVLSITLLSQSVSTEIDVADVQFLHSMNHPVGLSA